MGNHLLNLGSCNLEIFSRVECLGLLSEYAADTCGHCKTDIGVDIDLTNCHLSGTAKLFLGNAYGIGKLTAESVDLLNALVSNA